MLIVKNTAIGCSYYAFDVDEAVKKFIVGNKDNKDKIVCFGTSAMMKSMKKPVSKVADTVGVAVAHEEFHCIEWRREDK